MNGATPCWPTAASPITSSAPTASPCAATGRATSHASASRHQDQRERHERRRPGQPEAAEHVERRGEIGRAEEDPGDADDMEGHQPGDPGGNVKPAEALAHPALGREPRAVYPA